MTKAMDLQTEISKILMYVVSTSSVTVDMGTAAILVLIKKHEREVIRDYVWVIEQKEKEIQNLAKLKDPNGLKEVEK